MSTNSDLAANVAAVTAAIPQQQPIGHLVVPVDDVHTKGAAVNDVRDGVPDRRSIHQMEALHGQVGLGRFKLEDLAIALQVFEVLLDGVPLIQACRNPAIVLHQHW